MSLNFDDPSVQAYLKDYAESRVWDTLHWRGVKVCKIPTDLHVLQELITERRPQTIIETGTKHGGSALFLNDMLTLNGIDGKVLSIDINEPPRMLPPGADKIVFLTGSSVSSEILSQVLDLREGPTMVLLDSNHMRDYVSRELAAYAPLVSPMQYLVVEDTSFDFITFERKIQGTGPGKGPHEAVQSFLKMNPRFKHDSHLTRFGVTSNPYAYLRKF